MVSAICINDKNRPNEIPISKWVKKGVEYTVINVVLMLPQEVWGVELAEITLENCEPYEYFNISRFLFKKEDLDKIQEMIKRKKEDVIDIDKLVKQIEIQ